MASISALTKAQLVEELKKARERIAELEAQCVSEDGHGSGGSEHVESLSGPFLESVLNVLSTPVFIKDVRGAYLGCNAAFEAFLGVSADEIKGKTVFDLTGSEYAEVYDEKDRRLMEAGGVQIYDSRVPTRDRGVRDVMFTKTLVHDSSGNAAAIVGEVVDITEKKRVEAEYQENRELYKRLSSATFEAIFMSDKGRCIGQNEAARRMFGYTDAEAMGRMGTEWIHPDDRDLVMRKMMDEALAPYEVTALRKDGTTFPCEIQARMMRTEGKPVRVTALRDITLRKKAEQALIVEEAKYRTYVDNAPLGLVVADMDMRIIDANRCFSEMTGYGLDELLSMTVFDFSMPGANDAADIVQNFLSSGAMHLERVVRVKSGAGIPVKLDAVVLDNDRVMAFCTDITKRKKAENALRASEAKYRAYADSAPFGLFVVDGQGRYVDVNRHACAMLGFERAELLAMSIPDVLMKGDLQGWENFQILKREGVLHGERILLCKDGTEIQVSLDAVALDNDRYMAFCSDISARNAALEALRKSESMFRNTFELSPVGIAMVAPDYMLLQANKAYCDFLGYTEAEIRGLGIADFTHPDDVEENLRLQQMLRSGEIPSFQMSKRFIRKDGEIAHGLLVASSVRSIDGEMLFFLGQVLDITERVRAEEEKRHALERLSFHVDNSPLAVIEWRDGITIDSWSSQAEAIFGWSEDEVAGKTWKDFPFVLPEDTGNVSRHVQKLIGGRNNFKTSRNRNLHKDGSVVHCQWYNSVLRDETGKVQSILSQVADVSELKQTSAQLIEAKEQAEAANKAKSRFLANMSHEIRTPLNGIIGMLQLLLLTRVDAEQEEYVRTAVMSGKRLNRLVSDILDLSRVEADRMMIIHEPFEFRQCMESIRNLFQPEAERKELELRFHVDSSIPRRLTGDEARVRQVVNNLIGNAVKFTDIGEVAIEAYPLPARKPGEYRVLFAVSDTGIGIADHRIDEMFDAFTQAEENYTRIFQGAGLGLSIAKRLVDLMGGNMAVVSELDVGTTFHFCVPFKLDEESLDPGRSVSAEECGALSGVRVLVAEDEPDSRFFMVRMLKMEGCEVDAAENGEQALEKLRTRAYDAVIVDIQMPVLDGLAVVDAVRTSPEFGAVADIPIIAVTAYAMDSDRKKFMKAGVNEYLAKPVDFGRVKDVLAKVVKERN